MIRRKNRRSTAWLPAAVLGLLALALLDPAALVAQEEEFVPEGEETAEPATDFDAIDDLLALDEEVLSDPGT